MILISTRSWKSNGCADDDSSESSPSCSRRDRGSDIPWSTCGCTCRGSCARLNRTYWCRCGRCGSFWINDLDSDSAIFDNSCCLAIEWSDTINSDVARFWLCRERSGDFTLLCCYYRWHGSSSCSCLNERCISYFLWTRREWLERRHLLFSEFRPTKWFSSFILEIGIDGIRGCDIIGSTYTTSVIWLITEILLYTFDIFSSITNSDPSFHCIPWPRSFFLEIGIYSWDNSSDLTGGFFWWGIGERLSGITEIIDPIDPYTNKNQQKECPNEPDSECARQ